MYPRVVVDCKKLNQNFRDIVSLCHKNRISVSFVAKCVCAQKNIVDMAIKNDVDFIADSRISHLSGLDIPVPKMLIRISMPSEAEMVVKSADISLQSEISTVNSIAYYSKKYNKNHKIILMIDLGDLREGIFYENISEIDAFVENIIQYDSLELIGVGTNLSCFGGVLPDKKNLNALVDIAKHIKDKYNLELSIVSGGATSSIKSLKDNDIPNGINNLRIGEAFLFGHDESRNLSIPYLLQDCFNLEVQLIEKKKKPSVPIGELGVNAFGESVKFIDEGLMERGICAIGRQDVDIFNLTPVDKRIKILGGSSDHTVLNLNNAPEYGVGDIIKFNVGYSALLHLSTSNFIEWIFK